MGVCEAYSAFELLHALNLGPLEIVKDSCPVKEQMTSFVEQSGGAISLGLFELDKPFTCVLLPVCANNFGVECHVFSKTPHFTHLVKVLPNVG